MKGKIKTADEIKTEIEKITAKDIQKLAQTIFVNKGLNLAVIGQGLDTKALKKVLKL